MEAGCMKRSAIFPPQCIRLLQYSEQDIRRLAIGRLRLYYRLRPRRDWNGMQVVDKPHFFQGITIDARLTYIEPDGSNFIATVEATSLNKRKEVDYRFNWFRWLGESFCLSTFIIANLLGLLFLWGLLDLGTSSSVLEQGDGLLAPAGAMSTFWSRVGDLLVVLLGDPALSAVYETEVEGFNLLFNPVVAGSYWTLAKFLLFFWLLTALFLRLFPQRYRYIYAIEQFKRFHANDQWVAISYELFDKHQDPRYVELHHQCARYGFGLMELEPDRNWRILLAPKQGDYFKDLRQQLPTWLQNFDKTTRLNRILPTAKNVPKSLPPPLDPLSPQALQLGIGAEASEEQLAKASLPPPIIGRATPGQPSFKSLRWKYLRRRYWHLWWQIRHFLRPAVVKRRPNFFHFSRYWVAMGLLGCAVIIGVIYQHAGVKSVVEVGEQGAVSLPNPLEVDSQDYTPLDPIFEDRLNDINVRADGSRVNENTNKQRLPAPATTAYNLDDRLEQAPESPPEATLDPAILGYDSDVYYYRLAVGDTTLLFNCPSLSNSGSVFVLLYQVADNFEQALGLAWRLHNRTQLVVNVSRSDCFRTGAPGYIVFLEDPMTDESLVNYRYRTYTREWEIELEILVR